jgi:hypothetical protein
MLEAPEINMILSTSGYPAGTLPLEGEHEESNNRGADCDKPRKGQLPVIVSCGRRCSRGLWISLRKMKRWVLGSFRHGCWCRHCHRRHDEGAACDRAPHIHNIFLSSMLADLVISMGEHADWGGVLVGAGPDWALPAAGNWWVRSAGASRSRGCRSFLSCLARRVMACAAGVRATMPLATTVAPIRARVMVRMLA